MYHTGMNGGWPDIARLDDALIRLRRLWQTPPPHVLLEHDNDTRVELSTVLVTDAIHRAHVADPPAVVGVADVGRRLDVAASTASRLVDRAVTAGMIGRGTDPADSRRAILTVTPAGAALLTRAMHFRCGYLKRVLTGWTPTDIHTLAQLLDRFAGAVHDTGMPYDDKVTR